MKCQVYKSQYIVRKANYKDTDPVTMLTRTLSILSLIVISGIGTDGCLPASEYESNCIQPFTEWEMSGEIYERACDPELSVESNVVFDCIRTQTTSTPSCEYRNQTMEQVFYAIFSLTNDLNLTCEVFNNQECKAVSDCFYDSFNYTNAGNVVVGFYDFFCGPNYLQKGYACLNPECPYSSRKAGRSMIFLLSGGRHTSLLDLRTPVQNVCSNLTDTDTLCISEKKDTLTSCGIAHEISTFPSDSRLTCNVTNQSDSCIVETCSDNVANLFFEPFGLLSCATKVACGQIFEDNLLWTQTFAGQTLSYTCAQDETVLTGSISRTCLNNGTWGQVVNSCRLTDEAKQQIINQLNALSTRTNPPPTVDELSEVLNDVSYLLEDDEGLAVNEGILKDLLQIQDETVTRLAELTARNATDNTTEELQDNFVKSINAIVKPENSEVWEDLTADETTVVNPSRVLASTEKYVDVLQNQKCDSLGDSAFEQIEDYVYTAVNKHIAVDNYNGEIRFPSPDAQKPNNQIDLSTAYVTILAQTLTNKGVVGPVCTGGTYFTTLGQYLDNVDPELETTINDDDDVKLVVNSDIVSLNIKNVDQTVLDPPAIITITPKNPNYENPRCVYWDFNKQTSNVAQKGTWSDEGCRLLSFVDNVATCECTHLTNFCILMSPKSLAVIQALNIISAVGCGISIFCLILTIVCHMVVWRMVRSDRATILMNLCMALLFALVTFLVGIERVESRAACAAIAALIQFLFLAVFFLMFLMGIEILISVVHVFGTKFRIKVLLPLAWGAAALIVGVSLGATETEGYGNDRFCWLDTDSGLIWAFIGPAAFVIVANFVIMVVVFKKMASSTILKSKSAKVKALTAGRSLCVLLPLMGVTWMFGLLAINEDSTIMAYIFCIVNSLQGLFIFLFHCVFNRQIQDAWKHRQRRKRSLQTFSSDFRHKSKEGHSSSFDSPEKAKEISSPQPKRKGSHLDVDWMREERKTYHKNIRRGILKK